MNKRKTKKKLTAKQKKFCAEYVKCMGNGAQACRNAGYSGKYPDRQAYALKQDPDIKEYIDGICQAKEAADIADVDEILKYLTDVLRGTHESSEMAIVGLGKGRTMAMTFKRPPTEKEMLKAAEALCRCKGMYNDKLKVDSDMFVQIVDDVPDTGDLTGDDIS
jgi:phage terminase small subunit